VLYVCIVSVCVSSVRVYVRVCDYGCTFDGVAFVFFLKSFSLCFSLFLSSSFSIFAE